MPFGSALIVSAQFTILSALRVRPYLLSMKMATRDEIINECKGSRFIKSRIPEHDALVAFVPRGQEEDTVIKAATELKGCSRLFPVEGGYRVLIPYEGQEYDHSRFTLEKKAWDHEHCKACTADIEPMTLCWVTAPGNPYVLLCNSCHDELMKQ